MSFDSLMARMNEWPDSWKRSQADIYIGGMIVQALIPFFECLISQGITEKTFRKHFNNIWLLGGEIVDGVNRDDDLRDKTGNELLLSFVDSEGGPWSRHNHNEEEQSSFDSSCKKLYKYLVSGIS